MKPLILTARERAEPLLTTLIEHWKTELDELRRKNDNAELSEIQTAKIRGRVHQLKIAIALGDEPKFGPDGADSGT